TGLPAGSSTVPESGTVNPRATKAQDTRRPIDHLPGKQADEPARPHPRDPVDRLIAPEGRQYDGVFGRFPASEASLRPPLRRGAVRPTFFLVPRGLFCP